MSHSPLPLDEGKSPAPRYYPGLMSADPAEPAPSAAVPPSPPGLLRASVVLVICAALGYAVAATPLGAEEPAASAKAKTATSTPAPQAVPISVATVPAENIVEYREFTGRIQAAQDVEVRPRVSGTVESVNFREGGLVEKGDVLFTVDARPFQAALLSAEADVIAAQSAARLATRELERARRMFKDKAISQRELDERQSVHDSAQASLNMAEARRQLAALDVEYAEVRAPISGRIGWADITVGNIVRADQDIVTSIQSVSPVYVDFELDEQSYLALIKSARLFERTDEMPVSMGLSDEEDFTRQGRVLSFDNRLSPQGGTIRVRTEFANESGLLTPGLFARVRIGAPEERQAVVINDSAVNTDQSRRFVYVVGDDGVVEYRLVELGRMHPKGRIVNEGLSAGEKIIVNGLMRARPGMKVQPVMVDMMTLKPLQPPAGHTPDGDGRGD